MNCILPWTFDPEHFRTMWRQTIDYACSRYEPVKIYIWELHRLYTNYVHVLIILKSFYSCPRIETYKVDMNKTILIHATVDNTVFT